MDKQNIIDNWDNYYKSYLELNQDLVMAGINSKRAALNHFIKYGYSEGRKVFIQTQTPTTFPTHINPEPNPNLYLNQEPSTKIYLEEKMIIEKLDLNV